MKTLLKERLFPDGTFICGNCASKSRLSSIPEKPGTYKITCYKCKHETLLKVEAQNPVIEEKTKVIHHIQEETKEKLEPAPKKEDTAKYEGIFLKDTAILNAEKAKTKPLFEVSKFTVAEGAKSVWSTIFRDYLGELKLPANDIGFKWDGSFFNFVKKYRYLIAVFFLIVIPALSFIPVYKEYKLIQTELDGLLIELKKHKPTKITDRNGQLVAEIFQKKTGTLKLKDYPPKLIKIILAVEDQNFYSHHGIDFKALLRASYKNMVNFRYIQGASTITQQLSRILIKDRRKSIMRKFREALVAFAIESKMTKDQILEAYLNQVYLGHGAFGIENGANYYFSKKPGELKTMEIILLSSLASAPNKYSPFKNKDLSEMRVRQILKTLERKDIIDENFSAKLDDFYSELKQPAHQTVFGGRYDKAPYVTEHIREILKSIDPNINIYDMGGFTVETSLIKEAQEFISDEVAEHLKKLKEKGKVKRIKMRNTADRMDVSDDLQAAVIALDPSTGEILFMHGGGEQFHSKNQFNRAIQMRRQTGSSIKPVLYASGIESGVVNAATIMLDAPIVFGDGKNAWSPDNYGMSYDGEMSLREALAKSKNTIAVQIGERLGLPNIEKYYSSFFFPDPAEKSKRYRGDLSVTLGSLEISPLEMASAYGNFSNDGIIKRPLLIKRILNKEGKEIYNSSSFDEFNLKVPEERRVISPETAEVMVSLMKGSAGASGIYRHGYQGELAGKTGTTNDNIDAWFVGTKPHLSMAVWIGYDDPSYSLGKNGMGAEMAAPLWAKIGRKVKEMKIIPEEKFTFSKRASRLTVCRESGALSREDCPLKITELFSREKPSGTCKLSHDVGKKEEIFKKDL